MSPRQSGRPGAESPPSAARDRFTAALDALVRELEQDRSVVAAILCGSLSHDTVWDRSDIDLVLVTADDDRAQRRAITLDASGIHVHAMVWPRGEFRKVAEGAVHNSVIHSFIAKGQILFTHDPVIAELHARLRVPGERDIRMQLLEAGITAVCCGDKARKWLVTRGDLEYAALWILYAATPIARIEIISRGLLADREVIPQASSLNPPLFDVLYHGLLNRRKTAAAVGQALETMEGYVRERAASLFSPLIEHLREAGEARSCTELENHFTRHFGIGEITPACEYLAQERLIGKASLPARLTRRSTADLPELAFFALADANHAGGLAP